MIEPSAPEGRPVSLLQSHHIRTLAADHCADGIEVGLMSQPTLKNLMGSITFAVGNVQRHHSQRRLIRINRYLTGRNRIDTRKVNDFWDCSVTRSRTCQSEASKDHEAGKGDNSSSGFSYGSFHQM